MVKLQEESAKFIPGEAVTMPLAVDPVDLHEPSKHSPPMLSPKKTDHDSLASPSQMMMTGSMVRLAGGHPGIGSHFSPPPPPPMHHRMPKFHEFQCPLCPRSYAQKCSLYRHMKVHKNDKINESEVQQVPCTTGEGQFKCPFCIASYANAASLNVHVRTHAVGYRDMVKKPDAAAGDEEKIFPCPLCSRVFQRRSRLTVHLNISHRHEAHTAGPMNTMMSPGEGDDGDVDSDLDEEAPDAVDLLQNAGDASSPNRAVSSTLGAFACHLCGSSYTRRTNLNKHLEKRHHIDQSMLPKGSTADLELLQKLSVEEEMRAKMMGGPGEVVHTCPFCAFKTSHRFSLYQHMTTTHSTKELLKTPSPAPDDDEDGKAEKEEGAENSNGEIFPCSFCSRVYLRKCNLTQHMKMHFQEDADLRKRQVETLQNHNGQQEPMEQFCNDVEDEVDEVRRIIELTRAQPEAKSSVHECAICGLTFGIRANLLLHLQMHEKRALEKKKEKKTRSSSLDQPPPLIRPPQLPGMTPENAGFVMTQDTDRKTTIHNQEAYMLSHLQVLNQVQRMLMYGRQPTLSLLTSPGLPKKRLSSGSLDEESAAKKIRLAPRMNNRHWKLQDCDPNRRPVLKCSLCPFEISDANQDGLLQHMAAMHGVRCKLCPEAKFYAKRDFDQHCASEHSQMCQANEMEQLMVFGEIVDSGCKMELIDDHNDGDSVKSEGDRSKRSSASPLSANGDDDRSNPSLDCESDSLQMGDQMNSGGSTNGNSMRQICPKCGLHYAQKSSLNRHIRTHHNYSRVEEMIKAETMGLPSPRDGAKDLATMPPLLPPHMLSPHMLGLPGHQGIPAQGLMPDMSQLIPRSLLFGAHGFPPLPGNLQESKDQMMQRFLNHEEGPEAFFKAIRQQNDQRPCSSPDDEEVSAINLSLNNPPSPQDLSLNNPPSPQDLSLNNPPSPQDLSLNNPPSPQDLSLNNPPSPQDLSVRKEDKEEEEERKEVSPPAAKGRSRRKPQVVQRIIRNTTLEEEEEDEPVAVSQEDSDNDSLENEYGPQTGFDTSAFRAAAQVAVE